MRVTVWTSLCLSLFYLGINDSILLANTGRGSQNLSLIEPALSGNWEEVKRRIENGGDLEEKKVFRVIYSKSQVREGFYSPLCLAVVQRNKEAVALLLDHGALAQSLCHLDPYKAPVYPLYTSLGFPELDIARLLVDRGSHDFYSLFKAVERGDVDLVHKMLEKGEKADSTDWLGFTLFDYTQHEKMKELLLKHGGDPHKLASFFRVAHNIKILLLSVSVYKVSLFLFRYHIRQTLRESLHNALPQDCIDHIVEYVNWNQNQEY